ncbi:hypothetical protein [Nocardia vulneris]|uniref:hypothetical protein n=1 Tax=Nocardia vulneris TaxID=1141657 RepID=UPI0006901102|nr:hypothetical protein [Nocardia vulneris]
MDHTPTNPTPSDAEINSAANQLRDLIAIKTSKLADQLLHSPEFGTPEWEQEWNQRDTPEGQQRQAKWHLTKIRIQRAADIDPLGNVINARVFGADWDQIGAAYGIDATDAADRWNRACSGYVERLDAIRSQANPEPAQQDPAPSLDRPRNRIERSR